MQGEIQAYGDHQGKAIYRKTHRNQESQNPSSRIRCIDHYKKRKYMNQIIENSGKSNWLR